MESSPNRRPFRSIDPSDSPEVIALNVENGFSSVLHAFNGSDDYVPATRTILGYLYQLGLLNLPAHCLRMDLPPGGDESTSSVDTSVDQSAMNERAQRTRRQSESDVRSSLPAFRRTGEDPFITISGGGSKYHFESECDMLNMGKKAAVTTLGRTRNNSRLRLGEALQQKPYLEPCKYCSGG